MGKIDLNNADIVFLDIETSSLRPDADILAIGGLIVDQNMNLKEEFNFLIKPINLEKADNESLKLIGYEEQKWQNAKSLDEVLRYLYPKFKDKILAGWISHFDWSRLEKAFYAIGLDDPFDYRKIDIFSLAVAKYGLSNLGEKETLTKICQFLNIERGNSHHAYDDALASYKVFLKILDEDWEKIEVYTDGGSLNNPGEAAIGVVINFPNKTKRYHKRVGIKTNNQAEYLAVIYALEKIKLILGKEKCLKTKVVIKSDSEIITKQVEGIYKIVEKEIIPYFIKVHNLRTNFGKVEFKLIPRKENLADNLVKLELSTIYPPLLKN
ncbi:MAG: exonuclease domain-containing protein [Patescibacteria group bacterium]|nr:exonuclease domain-containing protein [Patescibacteria group bacterium]